MSDDHGFTQRPSRADIETMLLVYLVLILATLLAMKALASVI
jgi:hypothetical protein